MHTHFYTSKLLLTGFLYARVELWTSIFSVNHEILRAGFLLQRVSTQSAILLVVPWYSLHTFVPFTGMLFQSFSSIETGSYSNLRLTLLLNILN